MFVDAPLAARIDVAEARLCAGVAEHGSSRASSGHIVIPISGGQAIYAAPASPMNKVIGLALDTPLDVAALDQIEAEWDRRGEPVRIELSTLADAAVGGVLTERGYRLHGFENVLGLLLADARESPQITDIAVDVVSTPAEMRAWLDIAVTAFTCLDGTGSVADDVLPREQLAEVLEDFTSAPGFTRYLARLDGVPAGEAAMRIDGDLAQLAGAGTLPEARGRGVQKALLQRRLADARNAGCTLAVVTTAPGTRSQENVMRRGFHLLYTRAILVRPTPVADARHA